MAMMVCCKGKAARREWAVQHRNAELVVRIISIYL